MAELLVQDTGQPAVSVVAGAGRSMLNLVGRAGGDERSLLAAPALAQRQERLRGVPGASGHPGRRRCPAGLLGGPAARPEESIVLTPTRGVLRAARK